MADNVAINTGSGTTVAADEITDATLGSCKVQFIKLMDGTLDSTNKAVINSSGQLSVLCSQTTGTNLHTVVDSITGALPSGSNTLGSLKVTDGTNTAACKAASTAAAASDPSLVVNISPNSPAHPVTQSGTWTVQPGNTANTTAWLTTQVPSTSGGLSTYMAISAASTNLATPKASAGQIYNIQAFNTNASSVRYLKIYNKASNPTLASDTPIAVYMIPSGGGGIVVEISNGITCSTGIAVAITGGVANNDTTAISANEVVVNIQYK